MFADAINRLGGRVEVVGEEAGQAAARKLMRSIVTKGLPALLGEALELAAARNDAEWLWRHLVNELTALDETMIRRLLGGTGQHAGRRVAEMEAVQEMLAELAVPAPMTTATIESLRRVVAHGTPSSGLRDRKLI